LQHQAAAIDDHDLVNRLGSDNLALDQINGSDPPPHGVDVRSNYLFNSTIPGVEEADAILLVGTVKKHQRLFQVWLLQVVHGHLISNVIHFFILTHTFQFYITNHMFVCHRIPSS